MRIDLADPKPEDVAAAIDSLLDGLNITAVARDLGVARETVYRWRRGESEPTLPEIAAVVRHAEGVMVVRINDGQTRTLEDDVRELQRAVAGFSQVRGVIADIFDRLHATNDPEIQGLLARLREMGYS